MSAAEPPFDSVEGRLTQLREIKAHCADSFYASVTGLVRTIAEDPYASDEQKVRRIRAVFTAVLRLGDEASRPAERAPESGVFHCPGTVAFGPNVRFVCGKDGPHRPHEYGQVSADPTGQLYSRADDEQDDPTPPGPREPLHTGGMTEGGLVDETDAKPLPRCLPGCRRTDAEYGLGSSAHADGCPELTCPACGRYHVPWCTAAPRLGETGKPVEQGVFDGLPDCSPGCTNSGLNDHLDGCPRGAALGARLDRLDVTEQGLVDETPAKPVIRHFSFGHGQTDPDTGKHLLDHYVTVIAPSAEACTAAMFASRYGEVWAFPYGPDDPIWLEWGPRWTEHEVIDAMPKADRRAGVDGLGIAARCPKCNHWPFTGRHGEQGCFATGGTDRICGCTYAEPERDEGEYLVSHGPVKPPYGSPERAAYERDEASIDPDSSMEAHYDAETDRALKPTHMAYADGSTLCGLLSAGAAGRSQSPLWASVTCQDCKVTD